MRINNNLMAMNTHRQLSINNNAGSKSIEKLSSGYRINRAGDDAAGLAISEKMRGQIRGLTQASRNAQDGISLIQTAEGALQESQNILQKMRQLAVQAATDTNVELDREAIQNEIVELRQEIDRIAETTEFNTQKLLKGDGGSNLKGIGLPGAKLTTGADAVYTQASNTQTVTATTLVSAGTGAMSINLSGEELTVNIVVDSDANTDFEMRNVSSTGATIAVKDGSKTYADVLQSVSEAFNSIIDKNDILKGGYTATATTNGMKFDAVDGGKFKGALGNIAAGATNTLTGYTADAAPTAGATVAAVKATGTFAVPAMADANAVAQALGKGISIAGTTIELYDGSKGAYKGNAIGIDVRGATNQAGVAEAIREQIKGKIEGVEITGAGDNIIVTAIEGGKAGNNIEVKDGGSDAALKLTLQIGANEGQNLKVEMTDMRAKALGITEAKIDSNENASAAITVFDKAVSTVSEARAKLGAVQNRLEHTIKNLDTSAENLQASESRIRDVDMAQEMMEFTKNNILQQAAQAMLAQANQAPQGVLQLLR